MSALKLCSGTVALLSRDNVDTDQICPARFMQRRRAEGYSDAFLHDLRFAADGTVRDNPIDAVSGASILVAGRNFGGGSSRESAAYAVVDAGFRVVVASSFGDIFAANAARNGLVPALVHAEDLSRLTQHLELRRDHVVSVDVERLTIHAGNLSLDFHLDDSRRTMLLNGWDDLDVTLQYGDAIDAFVNKDRAERPWAAVTGSAPS